MSALTAILRFEVTRMMRSWKFLAITVGFPVLFYLLFLGDRSGSQVVYGKVPWREYLMVSMSSFGALIAALNAGGSRLAMERAGGWARQLRVTPVPASAYVITKVSAAMLVVLPVIGLVELVGALYGGVHLGGGAWAGLTVLPWVTALPFAVLGVFVGFVVGAEAAFPVVTGLLFLLAYFGGLFDPIGQMPGFLQGMAKALPNFQHLTLGLDVLDGRALGAEQWLVLAGYTMVLSVGIFWKHRREEAKGIA